MRVGGNAWRGVLLKVVPSEQEKCELIVLQDDSYLKEEHTWLCNSVSLQIWHAMSSVANYGHHKKKNLVL